MKIKAVLFDIGGVVCGSPITGAINYDKKHSLPTNWINVLITAQGINGAFQRLERGELTLDRFYHEFGEELSDCEKGGKAYRKYCSKIGIGEFLDLAGGGVYEGRILPIQTPALEAMEEIDEFEKIEVPTLPIDFRVNGKELWTMMMAEALEVDELVVNAIIRLKLSGMYKVAALTNNFHVPGAPKSTGIKVKGAIDVARIRKSLMEARANEDSAGASTQVLKSLFDIYVESAIEGRRKPDPEFYMIALSKLGVKPEEVVFLDDIGINLIAAKKLGIKTIRVLPGRSREAIEELEKIVGVELLSGRVPVLENRESKL